ncbi:MAG: hypothetical protein AAGG01_13035 [Planctomycetota bacterium]
MQTTQFTSEDLVTFTESRFRSGLNIYRQSSGISAESDGSSIAYVAPDGADRYAFRFESTQPGTFARVRRETRFDSPPTTMNVTLPDLNISEAIFDPTAGSLTWDLSGTSTGSLDVGRAVLTSEYSGLRGDPLGSWVIIFPPSTTSLTVPSAKGLPTLLNDQPSFSLELLDQSGVNGYDAFLGRLAEANGSFDAATLDRGVRLDSVASAAARFDFAIERPELGTITYDVGEGPVIVASGDRIFMPDGVQVTITATATGTGAYVDRIETVNGSGTGTGTAVGTLVIDSSDGAVDVLVEFDTL